MFLRRAATCCSITCPITWVHSEYSLDSGKLFLLKYHNAFRMTEAGHCASTYIILDRIIGNLFNFFISQINTIIVILYITVNLLFRDLKM